VESELARVNRWFSAGEGELGIAFQLDEVVELADANLLSLDEKKVAGLVDDPRVHPAREEFYVPLVFTDEVLAGGTPKYGLSTLPNGTCGGMQSRSGPELGVVAVAKSRAPTTVAHELGHYLGLCHTHAEDAPSAQVAVADPQSEQLASCGETCRSEGDGVCDTPFDPGPELCSYDLACEPLCRGGAAPDATNVMSYYTDCRGHFSPEQLRLMQHTLALRRGWQPCVGGRCRCRLGEDECPAGMSCRPSAAPNGARTGRCSLDGPRPPASDCDDTSQCGRGTLCLEETQRGLRRCVRACGESRAGCRCVSAGADLSVCIDDLER
jgi:hypothetical protein